MVALALIGVALACDTPTKSHELEALLDATDLAFAQADLTAFHQALDEAEARLPCLDEAAPQDLAARLHRAVGLGAWFRDAPVPAHEAFAAARRLDPGEGFDPDLVPEGHPLRDAWQALPLPEPGAGHVLPPPLEGSLRIDGRRLPLRPEGVPTLFQRLDGSGTVVETAYLWPGEPVPLYPVPSSPPPTTPEPTRPSLARPLRIAAVASLAGAAALYGSAAVVHDRYDDPSTSVDRLDGLRTLNNGLVLASGTTAVVGVGLGVASLRF